MRKITNLLKSYLMLNKAARKASRRHDVLEDMAWAANAGVTPRSKLSAYLSLRKQAGAEIVQEIQFELAEVAGAIEAFA